MIYFENINNYQKGYECFDKVKNYKFAVDSLILLKDFDLFFDYINEKSNELKEIKYHEL